MPRLKGRKRQELDSSDEGSASLEHRRGYPAPSLAQIPPQRSIPEELRQFTKSDVTFFLEKMPYALKPDSARSFWKLLQLYTEGVFTKSDFLQTLQDLKRDGSD